MNRTIVSKIVAGLGGGAAAQNVTAGDKPANAPPATSSPADPMAKAEKFQIVSTASTAADGSASAKPIAN